MPARYNISKEKLAKTQIMKRMVYNQLIRSRRILLIIAVIAILILIRRLLLNSPGILRKTEMSSSINKNDKERKINKKLVEVNDRQPAFKMYVYDGYEVTAERNRAQAKLIDNIKLYDKCQQNPKTNVIDIGASLGQFGLYAAACGCHVYMFEVDPIKISLLKMSIELNSFQSRVTLITKAVSDLASKTHIYMSFNRSSQVSLNRGYDNSDIYQVETINLSELNFTDIYLFRVDVEGYEIHVFRSSEKLFVKNGVHHVLFQYTPMGTDRVPQNDLLGYMRDILGGKRFYALHPREAVLYGPIYNEDIDEFYMKHHSIDLERDVYVLFQDEELNIDAKPYEFSTSFH